MIKSVFGKLTLVPWIIDYGSEKPEVEKNNLEINKETAVAETKNMGSPNDKKR